ncbi:MAG: sigma-54 dependent transcriptional regulator [Planctomycetota bacterium]
MSAPEQATRAATILVVDDDADIVTALEMILTYEGHRVWTADNGRSALERIEREARSERRADLVVSDVKMPIMDGLELLEALRSRADAPPVLLVSGHADVETAVAAVRRGAVDFLEKPLDQNRVLVSVQNALRHASLSRENRALKDRLSSPWRMIGTSEPMQRLAESVRRAARSEAAVLITGENGTGKEVVARNLHALGARAGGPFVAVNCAAIPAELIESELFGHERGAFTGASERRIGHFEAAHEGTLFLDEVGDMPLAAQAKVLRALEAREVVRVGGGRPIAVDCRVIAATNADLAEAVEAKSFRMDLFYRLNVVPLRVPALAERRADVPLLVAHFLEQLAADSGRRPVEITPEALDFLGELPFPGNVRQLRNLLAGASVFANGALERADFERLLEDGPALGASAAPVRAGDDPFASDTFEDFKDAAEARFFRLKLEENEGNVKRTAERLGMQRSHLYKKLARYGLR